MVGCGRTSATSRPSTTPSPRSTRPSESRARRSSAFVVAWTDISAVAAVMARLPAADEAFERRSDVYDTYNERGDVTPTRGQAAGPPGAEERVRRGPITPEELRMNVF